MPTSRSELAARLPELMLRDERRLGRRLDGIRGIKDQGRRQAALDGIAAEIEAAQRRLDERRAAVPPIRYPELPISERRDDIAAAIRDHQVVVVTGETGSGKTTQLPKICLELGRGLRGMIGHTQPRRLAARTVAERIAEELGADLGGSGNGIVGWKVRFTDQASPRTMVKLMTDGILLAELQNDRQLRQYDTIIVDEAHERSLNIDFILGYLKRLLPQRPDLKVIITSATIDPERFAEHFDGAPIVEVSGRSYPVEHRYRPYDEDDRDQIQAISDAVDELRAEPMGDILVFLSGEREIRDTADALHRQKLPDTEILPLYARLSAAEQHRIFAAHSGRRIVLATNVAETSLTVPGIRYVVDPGTARISRYSRRLKVQRLPIEPISQASANQRAGRCGRVADGICIRLYSQADFDARPEFTEPEILRTNLASVILQMTALGLGEVADFPFVDPPDRRQVKDGMQLLEELGALDAGRLTDIGRSLAQLPIDPRLGRMIIEADRNGCLPELLVIAAALSIQDPRERPADAEQAADAKHARFADPTSDFLAYLNLWNHLHQQRRELSSSAFRRLCRADYLHYLRVREWQDLHAQLRQVARGLGLTVNTIDTEQPTDQHRTAVHQSLLAGLLSHVGVYDPEARDYLGARGARFAIFPGSALFRKPPRWVMAAELVETTRLWARTCARIEPEWVEPLAGHLVKRSYSEPHWERRRGAVVALEKVTLYGVPIVTARKVNYSAIEPDLCRELFIRHALVEGDWDTRHEFFHRNRELLEDVEELEHRARRRDIMVDDQTLFDFYDERIPAEVVSARHFDSWWRKARRDRPDLLTFTPELLVSEHAGAVSERDYPDTWPHGEERLPLSYQFEPGSAADGVTLHVPLAVLNRLDPDQFSWQVPGLREELVGALLRSLPKQLRRAVVPVPDTARAAVATMTAYTEPLPEALSRELGLPHDSFDLAKVPDHLKITFRVLDGDGEPLAEGKDLAALARQLRPTVEATVSAVVGEDLERDDVRSFDVDTLPRVVHRRHGEHTLTGYPALVDRGDGVAIRVLPTEAEQRRAMWCGTRRLLLLGVPSPVKLVLRSLDNQAKLALSANPHGSVAAMLADCIDCAADAIIAGHGGPAWDRAGFERLRAAMAAELGPTVLTVLADVRRVLTAWRNVRTRLGALTAAVLRPSVDDLRAQLGNLVYPGFVTATGQHRLPDVARYLQAIERRLDGLERDPQRDRAWTQRVQAVQSEYDQLRRELPPSEELDEIRWMIEELRVSLFAQTLRTAYPISEKRIHRAMDALTG
jgi:ATP-dependent helicase HrpA